MNKKTIKIIKERIIILKEKYDVEFEYDENNDPNSVYLNDTREEFLDEGIDINTFLNYTEKIDELEQIDKSSVRCGKYRQTIVQKENYCLFYSDIPEFKTDKCILSIIENPFLIGLVASRENRYFEDMGFHPFSSYSAVELEYLGDEKLSVEEENSLIKRYLYFITTQFEYSISIGEFFSWAEIVNDENDGTTAEVALDHIPPYNKAMDYYLEALGASNYCIRFLSFYKVLEYFSPIVSKKAYYEEMNKKLDAMSVIGRSYEDLNEVFMIAKKYEKSQRDNEIPITIISNCVDLVTLFGFLPETIQLRIRKDVGLKKEERIDHRIDEVIKELSSILYSTRNSIVHAKSNYLKTGFECPEEVIEELNEFMDKLCQCIFIWNGRQLENYQLK